MIYFSSVVLEKNESTSTMEHVYTARCSLFKSLTQMRKNSPWNWGSLVVFAITEPESVMLWGGNKAAQACSCAASEPELACLTEVQVCMTGYT